MFLVEERTTGIEYSLIENINFLKVRSNMHILLCSVKCQLIFLYPPHAPKVGGGAKKFFLLATLANFVPPTFKTVVPPLAGTVQEAARWCNNIVIPHTTDILRCYRDVVKNYHLSVCYIYTLNISWNCIHLLLLHVPLTNPPLHINWSKLQGSGGNPP
jgi:hypothetical protein